MYIRITSRCNMKCDHCCFSCEPGKGEDMSLETYRQALRQVGDREDMFTLGGGEPTIHRQFDRFLGLAINENRNEDRLLVVTNGSMKDRALTLARLCDAGVLCAELSTDPYHDWDMVDPEVRDAFSGKTRDNSGVEHPVGRWAELYGEDPDHQGCVCDEWICNPDGTVVQCGCPDAPVLGDIWDFDDSYRGCMKEREDD